MWIVHHASQEALEALDAAHCKPDIKNGQIVWVRPLWLENMYEAAKVNGKLTPPSDQHVQPHKQ